MLYARGGVVHCNAPSVDILSSRPPPFPAQMRILRKLIAISLAVAHYFVLPLVVVRVYATRVNDFPALKIPVVYTVDGVNITEIFHLNYSQLNDWRAVSTQFALRVGVKDAYFQAGIRGQLNSLHFPIWVLDSDMGYDEGSATSELISDTPTEKEHRISSHQAALMLLHATINYCVNITLPTRKICSFMKYLSENDENLQDRWSYDHAWDYHTLHDDFSDRPTASSASSSSCSFNTLSELKTTIESQPSKLFIERLVAKLRLRRKSVLPRFLLDEIPFPSFLSMASSSDGDRTNSSCSTTEVGTEAVRRPRIVVQATVGAYTGGTLAMRMLAGELLGDLGYRVVFCHDHNRGLPDCARPAG